MDETAPADSQPNAPQDAPKTAAELFGDGTPPGNTRQKLLYAALDLFHTYGFHAVGVDQIIATVGVTKTTFYNHFESKDELAIEVISLRDRWETDAFSKAVQEKAGYDPKAMLLAMFDVLDDWFNLPDYEGCLFISASVEFPLPHDPVHEAAARHYTATVEAISRIAKAAGVQDVEGFSLEWVMLIQGAIIHRQMVGDNDSAMIAKPIAQQRLDHYLSFATPQAE